MLEIAAGQQQLVRVIRATPLTASEHAYRILINDLPPAAGSSHAGLNFVMEFSVPIFVGSGTPAVLAGRCRTVTAGSASTHAIAAARAHRSRKSNCSMPQARAC